jgi:(+)-neomenthol dehydrogenase
MASAVSQRIAVVTGGNKGIGLEICRQLATNDVFVILTARDESRGKEAVENLNKSGLNNVVYHQLDVTNPSTFSPLVDFIKSQYGKLDILVNSAGVMGITTSKEALESLDLKPGELLGSKAEQAKIAMKQTYETALQCLNTNYYGPKQLKKALIPLLSLSDSPTIVTVSSSLGQLKNVSNAEAKKVLGDAEGLTEEKVDEIVKHFLDAAKEDKLNERGWQYPLSAYIISKAAVNANSRILAKKYENFVINVVCPGNIKTDMNLNTGFGTVEEGAKGPVRLALLPKGSPSGRFYYRLVEEPF